MDKRQKKTRMAIFNALSELLKHKNYNSISVQDIVDKAIVGRSTFYIHFETKDALLKEYCDEFFGHITTYSKENKDDWRYAFTEENPYGGITHMLYHLKTDNRTIVSVLMNECEERIFEIFKEYIKEIFRPQIKTWLEKQKDSFPEEILVNHLTSSFISVLKWWVEGGMAYPTDEASDYFRVMIEPMFNK